jgi:hypothetical protein
MGLNDLRAATWPGEATRLGLTALIAGLVIYMRQVA